MDPSNWINLGIMLLTAVGVVVASRQANSAKDSASDAKQHEQAALETSRKMAEANERAAVALEEANTLARARSEKPRWNVVQISENQYRVENQGPGTAYDVSLAIPEYPAALLRGTGEETPVLEEGLAVSFFRFSAWGVPSDPALEITWRTEAGGPPQTAKCTLS